MYQGQFMKMYAKVLRTLGLSIIVSMTVCAASDQKMEINTDTIIGTYTTIATANYADTVKDAEKLEKAIHDFTNNPTQENLERSKKAWLNARESYGTSEIYRLSNGPIDAEEGWVAEAYGSLEGQINAWPLDENMIDYTIDANGKRTSGNIIDTKGNFDPGGEESSAINVDTITKEALTALNENGGDANVASGYHAIEFLLWGQDQDYSNFMKDNITHGAMKAGERPLSDFTSDTYASRRLSYLKAASSKLVSDLKKVASGWSPHISDDCAKNVEGCYRGAINNQLKGVDAKKNIPQKEAIKQILSGMGMFIKSEVANERIAVAVLTPSEEDEPSCFSDNTHRDIATAYQGFKNVLTGSYKEIHGKSFLDGTDAKTKQKILKLMHTIEEKIESIDRVAATKAHFDYQIRPDNPQSRVIVKLKNKMRKLGDMMRIVAEQNGIDLTPDDVTASNETEI
jgi:putative iron-regulated protein